MIHFVEGLREIDLKKKKGCTMFDLSKVSV